VGQAERDRERENLVGKVDFQKGKGGAEGRRGHTGVC